MTIAELVNEAHATAEEKGWHERKREFPELIALMHSELSEALEAYREMQFYKIARSVDTITVIEKPEGVPIELADCIIRIADACGALGIDLEKALRIKMDYNKIRPHRHGGKLA